MRIAVVGAGYVGIVAAVCWADLGHHVSCIDVDARKIENINNGIAPIFENGLETKLRKVIGEKRLEAYRDYEPVRGADVVFISVGTPSQTDGTMSVEHVKSAAESTARHLASEFTVIVVRSTVVPGTTEALGARIEQISHKKRGIDFGLAMIPEFLREGNAIGDFEAPDRIVIGCGDEKTKAILAKLHEPFGCPKIFVGIKTAEMIKYASNSFLACKVSFANEMAGICEKSGMDVDEVMRGVGSDKRIGEKFLVAGAGFGGSCFPKDVRAIIQYAKSVGSEATMLECVMDANRRQQTKLVEMLRSRIGNVGGKTIAVLGLAFKAQTDDIRESPAMEAVLALKGLGAKVRAYDPQAMERAKARVREIYYAEDWEDCLQGADAALLLTRWPQFERDAREYQRLLGRSPLFDAQRVLSAHEAKEAGLEYHCIGRGQA